PIGLPVTGEVRLSLEDRKGTTVTETRARNVMGQRVAVKLQRHTQRFTLPAALVVKIDVGSQVVRDTEQALALRNGLEIWGQTHKSDIAVQRVAAPAPAQLHRDAGPRVEVVSDLGAEASIGSHVTTVATLRVHGRRRPRLRLNAANPVIGRT